MNKHTGYDRLQLESWRQFENIDIKFHQRLTVITGANGAGKTSILNTIPMTNRAWSLQFFGVPSKTRDANGRSVYSTGLGRKLMKRYLAEKYAREARFRDKNSAGRHPMHYGPENTDVKIGQITYTNSETSAISVPGQDAQAYQITHSHTPNVRGIYIPSHRPAHAYTGVSHLPLAAFTKEEAFSSYYHQRYSQGQHMASAKTALISMAMFGEGNSRIGSNHVATELFDGFVRVLRELLPESIGFKDLAIRSPEVVFITQSGEFMVDSLSGGLMALFDLAWLIYFFAPTDGEFVVVMDEPENHLHPAMQRTLMGNLLRVRPRSFRFLTELSQHQSD